MSISFVSVYQFTSSVRFNNTRNFTDRFKLFHDLVQMLFFQADRFLFAMTKRFLKRDTEKKMPLKRQPFQEVVLLIRSSSITREWPSIFAQSWTLTTFLSNDCHRIVFTMLSICIQIIKMFMKIIQWPLKHFNKSEKGKKKRGWEKSDRKT